MTANDSLWEEHYNRMGDDIDEACYKYEDELRLNINEKEVKE